MGESYTKVQNNSVYFSGTSIFHDGRLSSGNTVANLGSGTAKYQDTFSGSYFPQWRSVIRAGGNATTHATGTKHTISGSLHYHYQRDAVITIPTNFDNSKFYQEFGSLFAAFPNPSWNDLPASLATEVRNRAIRKFLDDAKSCRSSFESGQDLGEIKQTIESLIHPMNSLKQLTLGYLARVKKHKQKYRGPSLRKAVSDSYLEYRFGWRPLALDIADAYSGLRDRSRMSETAPCYGSARGQSQLSSSVVDDTLQSDSRTVKSTNVYIDYSFRIKGAIRLNLVEGRIPVLQALQLSTLNDFAVTAWDLLPFSFVVDYFANVGDIVNALTFPSSDLTYVCGTSRMSMVNKVSYSIKLLPADSGSGYTWVSQTLDPAPNYELRTTLFDRSSLDSLDLVPRARISLPVSSRPWENIAALLSSNIKSLVPLKF